MAQPANAAGRPVAEELFESYLSSQELRWEYEREFGGKCPDYLVRHAGGEFVVEVEELRRPDPLPAGGFSPTDAIREALRRARNQLRGCKHLPTGILVYSEDFYRSVTPETVASAAFGPGFQDARRHDVVEPFAPALRFPGKYECPPGVPKLANPFLSRTDNTSISAVMVLMRYRLDEFQVAVWRELLSRQTSGEVLRPGASMDVMARLQHTTPVTYRFEGTIRVVVIENPHARIPFPRDVFRGPFDQRWTWQGEWCQPTWIGDTAARCFQEGVPFDLL
jgi:hypothetical protein